jgi:hypothetical protein
LTCADEFVGKGRASSSTVPAKRLDRVCCPANAEDDTGQGVAEDRLSNGDRQHNQRGEQGGEAAYQHTDGAQHPSVGVSDTWLDEPTKLGGETERGHIASARNTAAPPTMTNGAASCEDVNVRAQ